MLKRDPYIIHGLLATALLAAVLSIPPRVHSAESAPPSSTIRSSGTLVVKGTSTDLVMGWSCNSTSVCSTLPVAHTAVGDALLGAFNRDPVAFCDGAWLSVRIADASGRADQADTLLLSLPQDARNIVCPRPVWLKREPKQITPEPEGGTTVQWGAFRAQPVPGVTFR